MPHSIFNFNELSVMGVALWVAIAIFIAILLGVIIWRIIIHYKPNLDRKSKNNKNIGSINESLNKYVKTIILPKDAKLIYNLLIRNKHAKYNYSLIPIIIIKSNSIYLISNLIQNHKNEEISTENQQIMLNNGKKIYKVNDINLKWYDEILKIFETKFDIKRVQVTKVLLTLNTTDTKKLLDYHITSTYELINFLDYHNSTQQTSDYDLNIFTQKLLKANILKNTVAK